MKKYICLLISALVFNANYVFAQGEFLIELNPVTASFTKIGGPIQGVGWIYPHVRTYDEVNGKLIFQAGSISPDRLYSVNVSSGAMITNPFFPSSGGINAMRAPQYDNTTGVLYGLYYDTATTVFNLATINLSAGVHTLVGTNPITGLLGTTQGMDTYDENDHRYIVYSLNTLFFIDVQTGNSNSVPLVIQSGDEIAHICYNNTNDTLYGLFYENSTQLYYPVWIDQSSGVITKIGAGTALAESNGSATIDEANGFYIYNYQNQSSAYLSVLSLNTGNTIYNNKVVLDSFDNIANLKYDNVRQKLFAIHWDNKMAGTGVNDVHANNVNVYPNPASDKLFVELSQTYQNIDASLCNVNGQQLSTFRFDKAKEFTLSVAQFSSGVYFLSISTGDEHYTVKFIKE